MALSQPCLACPIDRRGPENRHRRNVLTGEGAVPPRFRRAGPAQLAENRRQTVASAEAAQWRSPAGRSRQAESAGIGRLI
jgi:hypothetical protein